MLSFLQFILSPLLCVDLVTVKNGRGGCKEQSRLDVSPPPAHHHAQLCRTPAHPLVLVHGPIARCHSQVACAGRRQDLPQEGVRPAAQTTPFRPPPLTPGTQRHGHDALRRHSSLRSQVRQLARPWLAVPDPHRSVLRRLGHSASADQLPVHNRRRAGHPWVGRRSSAAQPRREGALFWRGGGAEG